MTWRKGRRGRIPGVPPLRVKGVQSAHDNVLYIHAEFEIIKEEEPDTLDSKIIELEQELYRLVTTSFEACEVDKANPESYSRGQFQTAYIHCVNYHGRISNTVLRLRGVS